MLPEALAQRIGHGIEALEEQQLVHEVGPHLVAAPLAAHQARYLAQQLRGRPVKAGRRRRHHVRLTQQLEQKVDAAARLEPERAAEEVQRLVQQRLAADCVLLVLATCGQPHRRRAVRAVEPLGAVGLEDDALLLVLVGVDGLAKVHVPRASRRPRVVVCRKRVIVAVVHQLALDLEQPVAARP